LLSAAQFTLTGHVQGVGFRPFVYRLANKHQLTGYVQNRLGEVDIMACGDPESLEKFQADLINQAPPLSKPRVVHFERVAAECFEAFEIMASCSDANARIFVPADNFMCDDCRNELHDPDDRRYHYPFINCTQCGPRYTLMESLPYDRPNTSMANFKLCDACRDEYENPADRRFHAEPIACPNCGPGLDFEKGGHVECSDPDTEINAAVRELRAGSIVAVKGIGGYHLMVDAGNPVAVASLRERKRRPDKPLALMLPMKGVDGLDEVRKYAVMDDLEAKTLLDSSRPIVLAEKREGSGLADNIAPGLREIGVFLPYSPLHDLLLLRFGGPLVATSGNISGEPVLTSSEDASTRLSPIADAFLHHNRPIVRPADDPLVRQIAGAMRPLRMGRGSAPVELDLGHRLEEPVLAVGGHMKGALALGWEDRVVVSPHIGEMDNPRSMMIFEQLVADLQSLYGVEARHVLCDAHTGYTTHRWSRRQDLPYSTIFHHAAHASALVGEVADEEPWLVFTWDGVGLGVDGTMWGGEALLGRPGEWRRFASWRPFRIPGANLSGRAPWRSAASLYWECGETWDDCPDSDGLAHAAWRDGLNSPYSSAAGRLFDAAAAIICGTNDVSFEAQGPMQLEALCEQPASPIELPLVADGTAVLRSDWAPLLPMLGDQRLSQQHRAEVFHSSVAEALCTQARAARAEFGIRRVGLTGGVFQNRILAAEVVELLGKDGFEVHLPTALPCNDAALCFGQIVEFAAQNQGAQQ
jgi:hydrogenase maturation protein HypF